VSPVGYVMDTSHARPIVGVAPRREPAITYEVVPLEHFG
jgi:hypothetical protein